MLPRPLPVTLEVRTEYLEATLGLVKCLEISKEPIRECVTMPGCCCMPLLHNHLMDSCSYNFARKNTLLAAKLGGALHPPYAPLNPPLLTILSSFPIASSFTSSYLAASPFFRMRHSLAAGRFSQASFPGRFRLQFLENVGYVKNWPGGGNRGTKLVPKLRDKIRNGKPGFEARGETGSHKFTPFETVTS